ncbi:hypothetical protein [Larkinella punicea]|uniref:DUF91 domain-containing protein n=1 Tax=Larkinella punicea TaxID=2315727 RepID=A0A368JXB5_9BACT|nr:hypothetical protein [Larkinella punicea]RCR71273.1 hypothetical protein DUE52_03230 [Larkinella punicea]
MLLVVPDRNPATFIKVESDRFISLNIWERRHIQEWIRQAPEVLGEDLLVVSTEFNRFKNSDDRLDILALDRKGNLVIIELKRDGYAGFADLQALRYAAMVSSMRLEILLPYYITYQRQANCHDIDSDSALEQLREFVTEKESFEELSDKPRIILCSEGFSTELTTTVLWLNQHGMDISCVSIKPHKVGEQIIIVPNKIIPLQEAKQYLIEIQQKEEAKQQVNSRSKRPTTMKVLIESGRLKSGDKIYLSRFLPAYLQPASRTDLRYVAEITGKLGKNDNVRWLNDGSEYSISYLTHLIFLTYHPNNQHPGAIQGGIYWVTETGQSLAEMADDVWASKQILQ